MMTLYVSSASPFGRKVKLALGILGLETELGLFLELMLRSARARQSAESKSLMARLFYSGRSGLT